MFERKYLSLVDAAVSKNTKYKKLENYAGLLGLVKTSRFNPSRFGVNQDYETFCM